MTPVHPLKLGRACSGADSVELWDKGRIEYAPPPRFESYTSIICVIQSRQPILTFFVARTELPQDGQIYFRVLDVLDGVPAFVPLCAPGPVMR